MLEYQPPQRDFEFLLFELYKVQDQWAQIPAFTDFSEELVRAVLNEGGRVAQEVMAPLNQAGDDAGCVWEDGVVTAPAGFQGAYDELANGGWFGLSGNPDYEGQGMPKLLGCLLEEMFWGANTSLYLYGTLTVGSSICLDAYGSAEQKSTYLPKLYAGKWSGAMALTEAHAGTDLGIMRTKAVPNADGTYRISGSKIFITSGEHDMVENIVHLVLAKLPDAPAGSKGISLFIVPKFLPREGGLSDEPNGISSGSIEHKMGIKGSATSLMNYDDAVGYLIGEENQGLACMFTMMNYERLSVGLQGLGAGELAYQQAARYARYRLQGRAATGPQNPAAPADSLLVHADVRRMLLTIRSLTEAGRAFAMYVGLQLDLAKYSNDETAARRSQLLTPIAKAFLTDRGFDCAVMAQQVFGGHGYIKEWGVEQIVRDTRISQIYEGTNGIQALDLVGRKVLRDGGSTLRGLIASFAIDTVPVKYRDGLESAFDRVVDATAYIVAQADRDPNHAGAVSTDYLDLLGYTIYAWFWARMAGTVGEDDFGRAKRNCADFYFARILPKTMGLAVSVKSESASVMAMPDISF
jgi:alkylation response protein AidB-like acyl-CoA dehydrogenase